MKIQSWNIRGIDEAEVSIGLIRSIGPTKSLQFGVLVNFCSLEYGCNMGGDLVCIGLFKDASEMLF